MTDELALRLRALGTGFNLLQVQALYAPLLAGQPKDGVQVHQDERYGAHERHTLDVYQPTVAASAPRPVLVCVHGGGFIRGDKAAKANAGYRFAREGFVTVAPNYRLAPEGRWPSGPQDVAAVVRWLADHGHADLAVDLLLRTDFPSWGYMVSRGATTIWERWNGDTGDLAMNSFNHYALGAITAFLYRRVAGIDHASPGFTQLRICPLMDPRCGAGQAHHYTVQGRVSTRWGVDAMGTCWFEVELPAGVVASVILPDQPAAEIREGKHHFDNR